MRERFTITNNEEHLGESVERQESAVYDLLQQLSPQAALNLEHAIEIWQYSENGDQRQKERLKLQRTFGIPADFPDNQLLAFADKLFELLKERAPRSQSDISQGPKTSEHQEGTFVVGAPQSNLEHNIIEESASGTPGVEIPAGPMGNGSPPEKEQDEIIPNLQSSSLRATPITKQRGIDFHKSSLTQIRQKRRGKGSGWQWGYPYQEVRAQGWRGGQPRYKDMENHRSRKARNSEKAA